MSKLALILYSCFGFHRKLKYLASYSYIYITNVFISSFYIGGTGIQLNHFSQVHSYIASVSY